MLRESGPRGTGVSDERESERSKRGSVRRVAVDSLLSEFGFECGEGEKRCLCRDIAWDE